MDIKRRSPHRGKKKHPTYKRPPYIKRTPEEIADRKRQSLERKEQKEMTRTIKANIAQEMRVLKFMVKTDVLDHHHGRKTSLEDTLKMNLVRLQGLKAEMIEKIREEPYCIYNYRTAHTKYDSYIWNRQGEGKNHLPLCQIGRIFSHSEFETIYDVPLDGSYIFHGYDSGERGLGAFDYITASPKEKQVKAPYVNPGGFPPTIAH